MFTHIWGLNNVCTKKNTTSYVMVNKIVPLIKFTRWEKNYKNEQRSLAFGYDKPTEWRFYIMEMAGNPNRQIKRTEKCIPIDWPSSQIIFNVIFGWWTNFYYFRKNASIIGRQPASKCVGPSHILPYMRNLHWAYVVHITHIHWR